MRQVTLMLLAALLLSLSLESTAAAPDSEPSNAPPPRYIVKSDGIIYDVLTGQAVDGVVLADGRIVVYSGAR